MYKLFGLRAFAYMLLFPFSVLTAPSLSSDRIAKRISGVSYTAGTAQWLSGPNPVATLDNNIGIYFQTDGNLVVYNTASATALWSSGTAGQACNNGACRLVFQQDGNLVLLSPQAAYWQTVTNALPRHAISGYFLSFFNQPPYIKVLSSSQALMWASEGGSGVMMQNPDTTNDPFSNTGGTTPDLCKGVTVNCAVCYTNCGGMSSQTGPDWGTNKKTFGNTNACGSGVAGQSCGNPNPGPPVCGGHRRKRADRESEEEPERRCVQPRAD